MSVELLVVESEKAILDIESPNDIDLRLCTEESCDTYMLQNKVDGSSVTISWAFYMSGPNIKPHVPGPTKRASWRGIEASAVPTPRGGVEYTTSYDEASGEPARLFEVVDGIVRKALTLEHPDPRILLPAKHGIYIAYASNLVTFVFYRDLPEITLVSK